MDVNRHDADRKSRGTLPRKQAAEPPDDVNTQLAPAVRPDQIQKLQALGYRGAWPSTEAQAQSILRTLHGAECHHAAGASLHEDGARE